MLFSSSQLAVALDFDELSQAENFIHPLVGLPLVLKFGLRLLPQITPANVAQWKKQGFKIFIDAKLHDIPTQVAGAVKFWKNTGADFLTLHLSGGLEMLEYSQQVVQGSSLSLLGVSVLTSLDQNNFQQMGIQTPVSTLVNQWIQFGKNAGIAGFVLSVQELQQMSDKEKGNFCWCTPGLRLESEETHSDQKRSYTISQAHSAGSKLLVVGRSITQSSQPKNTIQNILEIIHGS